MEGLGPGQMKGKLRTKKTKESRAVANFCGEKENGGKKGGDEKNKIPKDQIGLQTGPEAAGTRKRLRQNGFAPGEKTKKAGEGGYHAGGNG